MRSDAFEKAIETAYDELPESVSALQEFHRDQKLLLMALDPGLYRDLGRRVASATRDSLPAAWQEYGQRVRAALRLPEDRGRMANALQHALGYFKQTLPSQERAAILRRIESYRRGPSESEEAKKPERGDTLEALLALFRDLSRKYQVVYLQSQVLFRAKD